MIMPTNVYGCLLRIENIDISQSELQQLAGIVAPIWYQIDGRLNLNPFFTSWEEIIQIWPEFTCFRIMEIHFGNPEARKVQWKLWEINQGPGWCLHSKPQLLQDWGLLFALSTGCPANCLACTRFFMKSCLVLTYCLACANCATHYHKPKLWLSTRRSTTLWFFAKAKLGLCSSLMQNSARLMTGLAKSMRSVHAWCRAAHAWCSMVPGSPDCLIRQSSFLGIYCLTPCTTGKPQMSSSSSNHNAQNWSDKAARYIGALLLTSLH